jgi:pimeloyl-ACP methyl ester carboxylesterase
MARRIPGARLAIIDDAGHLSNLERPDEFNRVLDGFLRSAR